MTASSLSVSGLHYTFEFITAAGTGPATFLGTTQVGVGNNPRSVVAADVDGDGDLDMLIANYLGNSVSVRLNDGKGQFSGTTQVGVGKTL